MTWIFSKGDQEKIMCHVEFAGQVVLVLDLKISQEGVAQLWSFWGETFC